MPPDSSNTIFYDALGDDLSTLKTISKTRAEEIFTFFNNCNLFRWQDDNNDCEDRANAICMMLDKWEIPNYKGWVLSGFFLKKDMGSLTNAWKYHVTALLPVQENNEVVYYIIDPATSAVLITIESWASHITDVPYSYHFIKQGTWYIFPDRKIEKDNWHKRNKRNHRWTMQGLSGINGVSCMGKAQLAFNKGKVKFTEDRFKKLVAEKPLG